MTGLRLAQKILAEVRAGSNLRRARKTIDLPHQMVEALKNRTTELREAGKGTVLIGNPGQADMRCLHPIPADTGKATDVENWDQFGQKGIGLMKLAEQQGTRVS